MKGAVSYAHISAWGANFTGADLSGANLGANYYIDLSLLLTTNCTSCMLRGKTVANSNECGRSRKWNSK